jgi:uncharacterized protein YukJ
MRNTFLVMIVGLVLFMVAPVQAEIYRYIDENGQKRWTDDLSQVPIEQRQAAQHVESVTNDTETPSASSEIAPSTVTDDKVIDMPTPAETGEVPSRDEIENEKAELDRLYQQLITERNRLDKMNAEPMDSVARADLNEQILEYNKKAETYETQLNRFNEKINAYNQQVVSQKKSSADK